MSQEYLYAVQRAELLGQLPPTQEEWIATNKQTELEDNDIENAVVQDLAQTEENIGRIGGGLDELNNILSATQKKINRFKTVCGSLGTLLKVRVSSRNNTPDHKPLASLEGDNECNSESLKDEMLTIDTSNSDIKDDAGQCKPNVRSPSFRKIDINEKMGSHLDKLDLLITKAENAQYSMQHQTKQMKKIIK